MDRIKKLKVKKQDGTFSDYIPIGADAENIDTTDGESVQLKLNKKPYYYNSVANMKADTKLKVGDMAVTLGYYSANDGGNSEYIIVNDDTLVDDGGSIHVLSNGLRAKLIDRETLLPEVFGAYGDNIHDDSTFIQNAINYCSGKSIFTLSEKTYLISNMLDFKDNVYNCNNGTFRININGEKQRESLFCNELFNGDGTILNKIQINDLNIIDEASPYAQTFSFKNCSVIFNKINVYKTHKGSVLDLYGVNPNSIINECNIKINVADPTDTNNLASCILVRGFGEYDTDNVIISKCNLSQNSVDETLWISSGYINLKNIKVSDCIITDTGNSNNTVYIGLNRTGRVDNVIFTNNIINKSLLTDRCISLIRTQNTDHTILPHTNFILSNNIINVTEGSTINNRIIVYGYPENNFHELLLTNNEINYLGETNIKAVVEGKVISDSNKLNCTNATHSFRDIYTSKNDNIKSIGGYINVSECNNITADLTSDFLNDSNGTGVIKINNCNIKGNYLMNLNKANGSKYYIKNNTLETTNTHVINNYNPTSTPTIVLSSNTFIGSSKCGFIKNVACNLIANNNYYTSSTEINEYRGIPGYAVDRDSYIIGSVLFSNTATKSIVRKISSGDQISNWEEI